MKTLRAGTAVEDGVLQWVIFLKHSFIHSSTWQLFEHRVSQALNAVPGPLVNKLELYISGSFWTRAGRGRVPGWGGPSGEQPGREELGLRPGDELPSDFRQHLAPSGGWDPEGVACWGQSTDRGPSPWPSKVLGWGKRVVQGSPPPLLSVTWSRLWLWSQRLSSFLNSQSLAHTSGAIYVNGWRMLPQGLSAFSTSRYLSYSHLKMKAKEVNPLAHGPRPCASCRQIQCSILSINFLSFPWILTTLSLNYSFYHLNNNSIHLKSHVLSAKHCVKCFHPSTRFIFTVSLWERDFYCSRATEEEVGAPAKQCVLEPRSEP